mmetsp:Transcript_20044/g.60920  ORF Transcript_20044/g.60920 Transcript_20044/m.60920 type:complete len:220 (+) Transcript_20044:1084-1743(+)
MLCRRNRKAWHPILMVKFLHQQDACEGVRAHEIDQVRCSAKPRRLDRRDTTIAKVVQLEVELRFTRAEGAASRCEVLCDDLLLLARRRGDGHGVPHLHEQRLKIIGEPVASRICVHHGEEHVFHRHNGTLWHRLDRNRQLAPTLLENVLPSRTIEVLSAHVRVDERLCLIDFLLCHNYTLQIPLDKILQAKEADILEFSAAALKVRVDVLRVWWILAVV